MPETRRVQDKFDARPANSLYELPEPSKMIDMTVRENQSLDSPQIDDQGINIKRRAVLGKPEIKEHLAGCFLPGKGNKSRKTVFGEDTVSYVRALQRQGPPQRGRVIGGQEVDIVVLQRQDFTLINFTDREFHCAVSMLRVLAQCLGTEINWIRPG